MYSPTTMMMKNCDALKTCYCCCSAAFAIVFELAIECADRFGCAMARAVTAWTVMVNSSCYCCWSAADSETAARVELD